MAAGSEKARGGLLPGQKVELAPLVSYQAGSVVSRALIDYQVGTVTLFAFDEGESVESLQDQLRTIVVRALYSKGAHEAARLLYSPDAAYVPSQPPVLYGSPAILR